MRDQALAGTCAGSGWEQTSASQQDLAEIWSVSPDEHAMPNCLYGTVKQAQTQPSGHIRAEDDAWTGFGTGMRVMLRFTIKQSTLLAETWASTTEAGRDQRCMTSPCQPPG